MSRLQMSCAFTIAALAASAALLVAAPVAQTGQQYPLESAAGLRGHNITADAVVHEGRRSVRVTMSEGARDRLLAMTPAQRDQATKTGDSGDYLAVIEGTAFANGVIEAEIAGTPQTGVFEGARGFVGIAFRVQDDLRTYDAFYLRPTNGRADEQLRRNRSTQYISHPAWTWFRLRTETPAQYESYVDLVPGAWTKIRIDVRGTEARLFVHDQPQPTLIVSDLKTGPNASGNVALWIDVATVAHFRNVTITPASAQ